MMAQAIWIALGGAAGSLVRAACQRWLNAERFPYGTLLVNLTGCLLIGMLWALYSRQHLSDQGRALLMTGFCGGFTTFSAFSQESLQLLQEKGAPYFLLYTFASVGGG